MKTIVAKFFLYLLLLTFSLSVNAQLNANFTATPTAGCAPLQQVSFSDISSGSPTGWLWNFGNGNTSTLQNPSAAYPNAGIYTVTLTVSNGAQSDVEVKTNFITVYAIPVANFMFTSGNICQGNTVIFTDQSTQGSGAIVNYQWDFGDGSVINTAVGNTLHSYALAGVQNASLLVTDVHGCQSVFNTIIDVKPKPVVAFAANPLLGCSIPLNTLFTNTTSGATNYTWKFGDNTTSSIQNPSHSYQTYGSFTVTLVANNQFGCIDSVKKNDYIKVENFDANFNADKLMGCNGDTFQFTQTTTFPAVSQQWFFGDGGTSTQINPSHIYAASGTYTCMLVAQDLAGCADSIVKPNYITINDYPIVVDSALIYTSCHSPFNVNLYAYSQPGVTYLWNFGDGTTSNQQFPQHTFTTANPLDSFMVTVAVTGPGGCTTIDTLDKKIRIIPFNAGFIYQPDPAGGCIPLTYLFTDTSHAPTAITHIWNFGDGSPIETTLSDVIQHVYIVDGTFVVTEILTTAQGCSDTVVHTVYAGFPVTANVAFVIDTICYNTAVTFNALGGVNTNGWLWLWGDGGTTSGQSASHAYLDTGTYAVSVMAAYNGCYGPPVPAGLITVLLPVPKFLNTQHDCNNPYTRTFYNTSIGADSIVWDFGDTTFAYNIDTITHTWATRGVRIISITAYNFTTGCFSTYKVIINITDPVADFYAIPLSGCTPLTVNFHSTSTDVGNNFFNTWILAPGVYRNGKDTVYTYNIPGTYDVSLIIRDIWGCPDTLTRLDYITVLGPNVGFTADTLRGCSPFTVTFTDTTISLAPIDSVNWNFGDGSPINHTLGSVTHTYTSPGLYNVILEAFDSAGCHFTKAKAQYIFVTKVNPKLTVDTFACRNDAVFFNANGTQVIGGIYNWNFGDATTAVTLTDTTSHTYTANGIFTITLMVTDTNGCDSSITRNILIQGPNAAFSYSSNTGCGYSQTQFYDTSTGIGVVGNHWYFGDGSQSIITDSVGHNYTAPGYYGVALVAINAAGCRDSVYIDSIIVVPGPTGTFIFEPDSGCPPLTVTFISSSPNASDYTWDFGDGNVTTTTNDTITHTYTTAITANPTLSLGTYLPDGSYCQLPAIKIGGSIVVKNVLQTDITANGNPVTTILAGPGEIINLNVTCNVSIPVTYTWSPDSGLSCIHCDNPTLTAGVSDQYYYVTAQDSAGCKAIDSILVSVNDCEHNLIVPNIMTPNGDLINDNFEIKPCSDYAYQIKIYDRWGIKIYENSGNAIIWNGTNNKGDEVPDGVYYYILNYNSKTKTGFVQLIREKK